MAYIKCKNCGLAFDFDWNNPLCPYCKTNNAPSSESDSKKELRVLNLYAGIGGNRKLWTGVKVTAVEKRDDIAAVYKYYFPKDEIIVGDAHQYLLDHHDEFDFVWTSTPCPSHSRARFWTAKNGFQGVKPVYPDMKLYQEILFLKHYYKGLWVSENVVPFYPPPCYSQYKTRPTLVLVEFSYRECRNKRSGYSERQKERLERITRVRSYKLSNPNAQRSNLPELRSSGNRPPYPQLRLKKTFIRKARNKFV